VRFRLKAPWPDFMAAYATPMTKAAWIVPKRYIEKVGDDGSKKAPVGAGPYRFGSYTPGVELVLEAHDRSWRKRPPVNRLVLRVVPDDATRPALLHRAGTGAAGVARRARTGTQAPRRGRPPPRGRCRRLQRRRVRRGFRGGRGARFRRSRHPYEAARGRASGVSPAVAGAALSALARV